MKKQHHAVIKAQARLESASKLNIDLSKQIERLGYKIQTGAMRSNRYKVYIYTVEAHKSLKINNSKYKACYVRTFWGKYKDIAFTPLVRRIEQENQAIQEFIENIKHIKRN